MKKVCLKDICILLFFFSLGLGSFACVLLTKNPLSAFIGKYVILDAPSTLKQIPDNVLSQLLKSGTVVSVDSIFSRLSDFYTLLVGFLGILLALAAFFGALYIFASSRNMIEDVSEKFMHTFIGSKNFYDKMNSMVNGTIDECLKDTSINSLNEKIAELETTNEQLTKSSNKFEAKITELENQMEEITNHCPIIDNIEQKKD